MVKAAKEAKAKEPFLDLKSRTANEKGKYVLMVFRPVPFGYGVMVFFVDEMKDLTDKPGLHVITREAYRGGKLVARFPAVFDYMLTARDQFEFREPDPEEDKPRNENEDVPAVSPKAYL